MALGSRAWARPGLEKYLSVCDDIQGPSSLNPYQVFSEKTHTLLQQIFEGLVRFDPKGNFEPALAERWERMNSTTMRFFLRHGVLFHNGEPFTALAVKFSLERYVDPRTHYPGYGFVNTIERVDVRDDHTVDVISRGPDGILLNRLAAWVHIIPPLYYERVGDEGFAQRPVGTGPFKFESWEKGRSLTLSKNDGYWMKDAPKTEGVVFKFIPAELQTDALLKGEIDVLTNLPGTRTLEVEKASGTFVVKVPTFYTATGSFNFCLPPLSNRNIRKALHLAIDKDDLIRYDVLGNGIPAGTLTFPGQFGHNAEIKPYPHDVEEAKRILRKEGYPRGFKLRFFVNANALRTARILAAQWKRIGIQCDAQVIPDAGLVDALKDRSRWDLTIADCPNPMNSAYFIPAIFIYSKSPFTLCDHKEFDEKLEQIVGTLDPQKQEALFKQLDRYIFEQALCLLTYQRIRTYGLSKRVKFMPYVTGMHYFHAAEKN